MLPYYFGYYWGAPTIFTIDQPIKQQLDCKFIRSYFLCKPTSTKTERENMQHVISNGWMEEVKGKLFMLHVCYCI